MSGAVGFECREASVELWAADSVSTFWIASTGIRLDSSGSGVAQLPGIDVSRDTAIWVNSITADGETVRFNEVEPAVVTMSSAAPVGESTSQTMTRLLAEQSRRYDVSLGDSHAEGATEHRLVYGIDRLLVTTELRFPGGIIRPIDGRPDGNEERRLLDRAVELSGWNSTVTAEPWSAQFGSAHPWTAIIFPSIWAPDYAEADAIARATRNSILGVLALNRGSRGRPVGVVIETREPHDRVSSKIRLELPTYSGNLIGGDFAGETQEGFLTQTLGIQQDPLIKLTVDLYSEAIADSSDDARYFRLWSVLETLATSRVGPGLPVLLPDGNQWPNGSTTKHAAPRVYSYLTSLGVSDVAPAVDLYTAVRAWYGRRNATAHRGRFDRSERGPATAASFAFTEMTPDSKYGVRDEWLAALERTARAVLSIELRSAAEGLLED